MRHRSEDILQIPLQPLYNNLDTYTYEIFEKDPVKYIFYQNAIEKALKDKIPNDEITNKTVIWQLFFFVIHFLYFTTDEHDEHEQWFDTVNEHQINKK